MLSTEELIVKLSRELYPTGRAFQWPDDGYAHKLHKALAKSEAKAWEDALSVINKSLLAVPENDQFDEDDASAWETRLGIITNPLTSLEDRKAAIIQKLAQPGVNPAKQHYLYLEFQLRKANFDVYVYENRFPTYPTGYVTMTPYDIVGLASSTKNQHGKFQHGQAQHDYYYNNKVVNHIDRHRDASWKVGQNYRSTFFIGGNPLGTFANIPASREAEFRQLILRLKPVQTCAFLFVNYV